MGRLLPRSRRLLLFALVLTASALMREADSPAISQAVIWLPSGVAIAGLWLLGPSAWWVVALVTVLQRLLLGYDLAVLLPAAAGSALEAVVGVTILRSLGYRGTLERLRDVATLFVVAAVAPLASLLCSWAARGYFWHDPGMPFYAGWAGWWRMNALGVLTVLPLAGTWIGPPIAPIRDRATLQAVGIGGAICLLLAGAMTLFATGAVAVLLLCLVLPLALYAALRFGPRGAASAASLTALVVAIATTHGFGPFLLVPMNQRLEAVQGFEVLLVAVPLVFGALIAERETALAGRLKSDTLRNAFQQILPDITYRLSADGTYLDMYVPPGAIATVPREELIGRHVRDVVPAQAEAMERLIRAALAGKPPVPIEYVLSSLGRPRVGEARYLPLGDGEVLGLVRDITDRKRAEAMLAWQARVLELVATGQPIADVLDATVRGIEGLTGDGLCSILLLEGTRMHVAAAPSLPADYNAAIEGVEIGPKAGSCGTAAYTGRTVIVRDIATDPLWEDYRSAALPHGLRACWSVPIRAASGEILGTFAVYYREPRAPEPQELALVERAAALAGIALERERREDLLASINRNVNEGLYRSTPVGGLVYANAAFARMFGYESPEAMLRVPSAMRFQDPARREELERVIAERGCFANEEVRFVRKDGTPFWALLSSTGVRGHNGTVQYYDGAVADITERKRLEEQLRQAQKMEAVGKLAGGVAHDFNNLLTAITGYAEALRETLPPGGQQHEDAEEITRAAERAASLTRQLLAYSRQQILAPQVLDLPRVVDQMGGMLRRLIGEDVRLVIHHAGAECFVRVDRGQLEQVLLNLVLNARDAMPGGGTLTISTATVRLDENFARTFLEIQPGPHVCLTVADTGAGMAADVQRRAFDPFFTTKEQGKGTGLGLSTVYGIVRQSEGGIHLESTPGLGTTVRVYLPEVRERPADNPGSGAPPAMPPASGTVLVVEDEEMVRDLVCRTLRRAGYTVLVAEHGEAALRVVGEWAGEIDLMITDVIMPRMGGRKLADLLAGMRPGLRVLFVSGYTNEAILDTGGFGHGTDYLQKPFSPSALLDRVRDMLSTERLGA